MKLPRELRSLVKHSVVILGQVLQKELGEKAYQRIEEIRSAMVEIRDVAPAAALLKLQSNYKKLESLKPKERHDVAHAFTLMLELMNSCENAYRSHRLNLKSSVLPESETPAELPKGIVYVLTAHPTEARSPQNIVCFHEIQNILITILERSKNIPDPEQEIEFSSTDRETLLHALEIAWRTPINRNRSPKVKDEAEHIYSLLFRDEIFFSLISQNGI